MTMKNMLLLSILMMLVCVNASAQQYVYYKSTGTHVNVREGPGKNYGIVEYSGAYGSEGIVQLDKGVIVASDGIVRNGFRHVFYAGTYNLWEDGWVSQQYLKRCVRCSVCKGKGYFNRKCPECNGTGVHSCCDYTGKARCNSCYGVGYK